MSLINLRNVSIGFGDYLLLNQANLTINAGEKTCLLGRNGAGKSTLLKLIAGEIEPDSGIIERQPGLIIASLPQAVPHDLNGSIFDIVSQGLGTIGQTIIEFEKLILEPDAYTDPKKLKRIESLHNKIETENAWQMKSLVDAVLTRMQLRGTDEISELSGGMKRRVLLAQAIVLKPDVLLLDEPTNHLDVEAIEWLENFLHNYEGTLLFITHDRVFMQKIANRIVELDLGQLNSWPGDYNAFLTYKEEALHAEQVAQKLFDKKLAQEEVWIRQGIKARRTRNEGRVRALKKLREQRSERRTREGAVKLQAGGSEQSGKMVFEVENITHQFENAPIIKNFSTTIMRGDKIGILGPNGSGKSTLLKILLGELKPDAGDVKVGTKCEIAYFDQHRHLLEDDKTVVENVGQGRESITINGKARHVLSYLQDFLFTPTRARRSVKMLSGGERNRAMLAKILSLPSNVLVLDEPTNDLDVETLEILEDLLVSYPGTILLVSHDRAFINNVVTQTLVMEGNGKVGEYVGGYDDWVRQSQRVKTDSEIKTLKEKIIKQEKSVEKLTFSEQHELKELPKKIEKLEHKHVELTEKISKPDFYQQDQAFITQAHKDIQDLEQEIASLYARWEILEAKK